MRHSHYRAEEYPRSSAHRSCHGQMTRGRLRANGSYRVLKPTPVSLLDRTEQVLRSPAVRNVRFETRSSFLREDRLPPPLARPASRTSGPLPTSSRAREQLDG